MALCIACGGEDHEREDCPYREAAAALWKAGIHVTPSQAREMDEAGRDR